MTEREQTVQRLMEVQGLPREEAELRVQDDDLWLVDAELRVGLEGQAAVEEWEEAAAFASAINRGVGWGEFSNTATAHLVSDLDMRAEEALRRARERTSRMR
jgi:hypothetical protein